MNESLEKESDVTGVRMRTAAAVSLLIHLLALYSVTGIYGIIENNKKKNYISVEFMENARGFNQASPSENARSVRRPDAKSQSVEKTERAPEEKMSMTPHIDPLTAPAHPDASSHETGPVSNAKADYLAAHRVSKLPLFKNQVKPTFPSSERAAGVESRVLVEVYINEYGDVDDVKVINSGGRLFDEAVVKAAKASSFEPGYVDHRPMRVRVQIPYTFKLR